jgi:D-alanyl-D-alanine dipeptidase
MPIHTDLSSLVPELRKKATDAIYAMTHDDTLKSMGVQTVTVIETLRELATQMAYYSRGRMAAEDVKAMYKAAGLWRVTEDDAYKAITWTLDSKHLRGEAVDIAPMRAGRVWWNAPQIVWERIGKLGEDQGLAWGGRWKNADCPHMEIIT